MSAIVLKKGGRINLTKEAPALKVVRAELYWEPNKTDTGSSFDLDVTVFGLTHASGKPQLLDAQEGDNFMVFYNHKVSADGAITHDGDNKTGGQDGEKILVDLEKLDQRVEEISFIVTIFEAEERKQNFGQVPRAGIRLINDETNDVIATFDLEEDFSVETAVQVGSLYRKDGGFGFKSVGTGYQLGLDSFVIGYGAGDALEG